MIDKLLGEYKVIKQYDTKLDRVIYMLLDRDNEKIIKTTSMREALNIIQKFLQFEEGGYNESA